MNRSGDLKLGFGPIHVSFSCDGEFVTFQVYRNAEALGSPEQLSRAELFERDSKLKRVAIPTIFPPCHRATFACLACGFARTERTGRRGQEFLRTRYGLAITRFGFESRNLRTHCPQRTRQLRDMIHKTCRPIHSPRIDSPMQLRPVQAYLLRHLAVSSQHRLFPPQPRDNPSGAKLPLPLWTVKVRKATLSPCPRSKIEGLGERICQRMSLGKHRQEIISRRSPLDARKLPGHVGLF